MNKSQIASIGICFLTDVGWQSNRNICNLMAAFPGRPKSKFGYPENLVLLVLKFAMNTHPDLTGICREWGDSLSVKEIKGNEWEIRFCGRRIAIKIPQLTQKSIARFASRLQSRFIKLAHQEKSRRESEISRSTTTIPTATTT